MDDNRTERITFKTVVMSFLNKLSKLTSLSQPYDVHMDTFWAILEPYTNEDDHMRWERETYKMDYKANMSKLRLISLVLYRNGVIPNRHIRNRKFEVYIEGRQVGTKKGMTSHIVDDIAIQEWFFNHLRLLSYLSQYRMDATVHIDALWFFLSPYITEEDYYNWEQNNKTLGNKDSEKFHYYLWNITKIRICLTVMDRANFLWRQSGVDAPENYIKEDNEIGIRSKFGRV